MLILGLVLTALCSSRYLTVLVAPEEWGARPKGSLCARLLSLLAGQKKGRMSEIYVIRSLKLGFPTPKQCAAVIIAVFKFRNSTVGHHAHRRFLEFAHFSFRRPRSVFYMVSWYK